MKALSLVLKQSLRLACFGLVRPIAKRHMSTPPQLRTGTAALVGRNAIVLERIANDEASGCARIEGGQVWTAHAFDDDRVIEPGERVKPLPQPAEDRGSELLGLLGEHLRRRVGSLGHVRFVAAMHQRVADGRDCR